MSILVDWHGSRGIDGRYLLCIDIGDLRLCIAWLEKQLRWMEENGKTATSIMEFHSEDSDEV